MTKAELEAIYTSVTASLDLVMLVGAAAMGAAVGRLLEEYESDTKQVTVIDRPQIPDLGLELETNRRQRRAYGSKKQRLKGLRP